MHVVATAGHVDHGKSTLVRALTGRDPDRLEEEHRRGLSIQLGYAWTTLAGVGEVAFVDVPGHERFVSTMLAGVGPAPAVLLVVAADDPWMPQAAEHLAALDALGVEHGLVAVTRSDLADPGPAMARVAAELVGTSLRGAPIVPVSSATGVGLDELRAALVDLVRGVPASDPAADARLWVDRRFTVSGAGTVVTGTLPAGTVSRGDTLSTETGTVRVRAVQALERPVDAVSGVARVALNLTGDTDDLDRSSILTTPGTHLWTDTVDVRVGGEPAGLPNRPMLHVGASSQLVHCRPLADDLVRLRLERALPLRVGDRGLLRDPGSRTVWGVRVLDPLPPPLRRRGAAAVRAADLEGMTGEPDLASEVRRREVVDIETLRRIGVRDDVSGEETAALRAGPWLVSTDRARRAAEELAVLVSDHARARPLDPGLPLTVLAERLGLPAPEVAAALVPASLRVAGGRVLAPAGDRLPRDVEHALQILGEDLTGQPFAAPTADRLRELGLDASRLAAATRAGRLLRLAPGIVLLPDADLRAVGVLQTLPQPFTASAARSALGTSRRVVLPLLEHLDRERLTRRLPDDRRTVVAGYPRSAGSPSAASSS